jgi:hypothetical protein
LEDGVFLFRLSNFIALFAQFALKINRRKREMKNIVLGVIAAAAILASVAGAMAQARNWPGGENYYGRNTKDPIKNFAPDGL